MLEKQILCTEDDLILLGGLALQAEVGDFQENVIKNVSGCLVVAWSFVLALGFNNTLISVISSHPHPLM